MGRYAFSREDSAMHLDAKPSLSAVQQRRRLSGSEAIDMDKAKETAGLRVVALAAEAYGGYGGIAQSTRDLMLSFSSIEAIEAIDILPRHAGDGTGELPKKITQHRPRPGRLAYTFASCRLVASVRPHIIYCGHLFMMPLAATLAHLYSAKLITHLHGLELWKPLSRLRRLGLQRADLALCVSDDTKDRLLDATKLTDDRIEVIFNVYADDFKVGDRAAARGSLGLGSEKVLLTVSRLDARQRHKGHDLVIPLVAQLSANGHDLIYLIAGEGDDRPRLEALVHNCGIDAHVRFLGHVPRAQMPSLYQAADLYVMPSTGEGFGIAFVEAMACGTPAVGLAVGGAPDALRDGELGRAVTREDFSDALEKALLEPTHDRDGLSSRVAARFGQAKFNSRVHRSLERLVD